MNSSFLSAYPHLRYLLKQTDSLPCLHYVSPCVGADHLLVLWTWPSLRSSSFHFVFPLSVLEILFVDVGPAISVLSFLLYERGLQIQ
jgi:hypothetical protein